jgi:hypothetical protein
MLIDKRYRKIGLSYYLPLLSRAICMAEFKTDFHTGIVRESLAASIVPTQRYGFSNVEKIFRGVLPGVTGNPEDVFLCWMDANEALNTVERENRSQFMGIEKNA